MYGQHGRTASPQPQASSQGQVSPSLALCTCLTCPGRTLDSLYTPKPAQVPPVLTAWPSSMPDRDIFGCCPALKKLQGFSIADIGLQKIPELLNTRSQLCQVMYRRCRSSCPICTARCHVQAGHAFGYTEVAPIPEVNHLTPPHLLPRHRMPIKDAPIWPQDSPLAAPSHPFPDIAPIGSHPLLSAGFDLCLLHHPLESKRYV